MSTNLNKLTRHKSVLKSNFIFTVVCTLLLSISLVANYVGKNYSSKINDLKKQLNSVLNEKKEIKTENKNIKNSIDELNLLIEKTEEELN